MPNQYGFPTRGELKRRTNRVDIAPGTYTTTHRDDDPGDDLVVVSSVKSIFDYPTSMGTAGLLSYGKDHDVNSIGIVGGRHTVQFPDELLWGTIHDGGVDPFDSVNYPRMDYDSVRVQAQECVVYDSWFRSGEDSIGVFPRDSVQGDNDVLTDKFYVEGCYAEYVRDDFIENDYGMPGVINDCFIDGTNTFISCQVTQNTPDVVNTGAWVVVKNCIVRCYNMPNTDDGGTDDMGWNAFWKWDLGAPALRVEDSIFLMEAQPSTSAANRTWPGVPGATASTSKGSYKNVTVVLGPSYTTDPDFTEPANRRLPHQNQGVRITTNYQEYADAVTAWKNAHPRFFPELYPVMNFPPTFNRRRHGRI